MAAILVEPSPESLPARRALLFPKAPRMTATDSRALFRLSRDSVRVQHLHRHLRIQRPVMAGQGRNAAVPGQNQRNPSIRIAVIGAQTSDDIFRLEDLVPCVPHRDSPAHQPWNSLQHPGRIRRRVFRRSATRCALVTPRLSPKPSLHLIGVMQSNASNDAVETFDGKFSVGRCSGHRPAEISHPAAAPHTKPPCAKHLCMPMATAPRDAPCPRAVGANLRRTMCSRSNLS